LVEANKNEGERKIRDRKEVVTIDLFMKGQDPESLNFKYGRWLNFFTEKPGYYNTKGKSPKNKRRGGLPPPKPFYFEEYSFVPFFEFLRAAWAAASRAIGTR
jgi:hypothetical protein